MLARFIAAGVLVCTLAVASTPSAAAPSSEVITSEATTSVTLVEATHTVRVGYRTRSGALRQARITISPAERGARAEWVRGLEAVFFSAPRSTPGLSRYRLADRIIEVEREGDSFVGTGLVPAPEYLREFLLRSGDTTHGFALPQSGNDGDEPPAEDPPKEDPPTEDPPADDDCSCAGCMEICDPWTCECSDPDPFPEMEGYRSNGRGVSFMI